MKKQISLHNKTILVTGSPGFVGAALVQRLLEIVEYGRIISLDNMNDYYDPALKEYRLNQIGNTALTSSCEHLFQKGSIADADFVNAIFEQYHPEIVVHLAAQAGVRHSITHPQDYIESNLIGFFHILEACRNHPPEHLVYASSSSVYGAGCDIPFSVDDKCDRPVSLYAATKKSDELLAYSYSSLYQIPTTGLRFFTVYGPAGRPDMFYYSATEKLCRGEKIKLFNYGNCERDFTYIDDVIEGVVRVMQKAPEVSVQPSQTAPPYALYNIGKGSPDNLQMFIKILEEELVSAEVLPEGFDLPSHLEYVGMQPGDVPITYADTTALEQDFGYRPVKDLREGLKQFAVWYREYHKE